MSRREGHDGISLAGRWECGNCGASGDGWWDDVDGLTLHDGAVRIDEHICDEDDGFEVLDAEDAMEREGLHQ